MILNGQISSIKPLTERRKVKCERIEGEKIKILGIGARTAPIGRYRITWKARLNLPQVSCVMSVKPRKQRIIVRTKRPSFAR